MAGKKKVWRQRLFGLQRACPRLLATCLRGHIDHPLAEQKRDKQNHHGRPNCCQPMHQVTPRPSARLIRLELTHQAGPETRSKKRVLRNGQHALQRDERPLARLLVDPNRVDRSPCREVLETPTEVCQVDSIHRGTHADHG